MLETLETRELFVLSSGAVPLLGTYHRPAGSVAHAELTDCKNRLGVLFLNSLSLPRAATGDSAVRWADSIAATGYPAFRIDLPGLGDSQGMASTDLLEIINAGGLAPAVSAAVKELVDRFALSGIVIFGHCAGSVSALYTAAIAKECKGLILLDTYFYLPQAKRPELRERLSGWARRSRLGGALSNVYDRAKKLLLFVRGSGLPGNANAKLLARWQQMANAGLPILLLQAPGIKAQGSKPRVGEFDYIDYVVKLAGRRSQVKVKFIESADHSFANREGREAVEQQIADWLKAYFPLKDPSRNAIGQASADGGELQNPSRRASASSPDMGYVLGRR
jgi:alpha-beta hydrolase superfamily lysophospholipase